jgi:hypothetical protein
VKRLLPIVLAAGCTHGSAIVLDPDVLTGGVISASHTEVQVASDLADSASTRVRGVDGVAMGLRPGDRVRVRRRSAYVGKADPLDWDCSAPGACDVTRE